MIYLKDKKVYPYYGDYNPLSIYQGSKKIAGWVEKTADISSNIRIENGYSTMKVKPFGKSEQVQEDVNYPEITMTLDSESGNYYLDGVTTQNGTPSPDNVVDFVNTYPAGNYKTTINDKTYVITLNDDLRSVGSTADRLWLDVTNVKAWVDKKIYMQVFNNPSAWTLFGGQEYRFRANWQDSHQSLFASCNYFVEIPSSELGTNIGMYTLNSSYLRISYPNKTLEEFRNWITEKNESGKPLTAIYILRYAEENLIDQNCYEWNVPSPNNKIDIENVEGNLEIKVVGKNLFNKNDIKAAVYLNVNGAEQSSTYWDTSNYMDVEAGNKLTYQGISQVGGFGYNAFYDKDKNFISSFKSVVGGETKDIPENAKYVRFCFVRAVGDVQTFQLELGETATEFEEYKEQTVTFPFAEGQKLMKDGYLGENGIVNKRKQIVLTGTENWSKRTNKNNSFNLYIDEKSMSGISTHYLPFIASNEIDTQNGIYLLNTLAIIITDLRFTTVEEFKTWLAEQYSAGTPVIVEYVLAEEETTAYTSMQQTAYNALQKLKTYRTVTNISNSQDTNMKIIYKINN